MKKNKVRKTIVGRLPVSSKPCKVEIPKTVYNRRKEKEQWVVGVKEAH